MTSGPLDEAAAALYVLPPEDFTAERNAKAAEASDGLAKQIKALRKPAVAAWAVNLLVHDGQLSPAVELSAALREAQDDLNAKELMELGKQRRQLVASLAKRAAELAKEHGATLSASAQDAVSVTINAAITDERAGAAVLTGRLIKPLEPGDLDNVDLSEIVAGSLEGHGPAPTRPRTNDLIERRARKAAEAAAQAAERTASEAQRELARIAARREKEKEHADLLHERVEKLRAELERAAADAVAADDELDALEAEHRDAASRAKEAAKDAERARAAVDK